MSLKSLLLCSDEKIVRILRRVLGDLDISVDLCADADSALRKLTRERFEAIIVDVIDDGASDVLRSARSAPCNKQAVAVAIVEPIIGLKAVFEIGAHFVLYKPVSSERAKSSFRAARALMKSERRRNARVPVQIPVSLQNPKTGASMRVTTSDLSEGGMAVGIRGGHRPRGRWQISSRCRGLRPLWTFPPSSPGKERARKRDCDSWRFRRKRHIRCGSGLNRILRTRSRTIRQSAASLPT